MVIGDSLSSIFKCTLESGKDATAGTSLDRPGAATAPFLRALMRSDDAGCYKEGPLRISYEMRVSAMDHTITRLCRQSWRAQWPTGKHAVADTLACVGNGPTVPNMACLPIAILRAFGQRVAENWL